ncbi:hypothetical protein CNECB9_5230014 [Cupriavidus necator]|uniref:Uncharacterized protein n=1 Tax=Cupriavidus necator TaxID=106590 RepID=A0A1K0JWF9_CUPNE|nr:hypothetical protein CNECB9_5230014 [Cupriavidus necator]
MNPTGYRGMARASLSSVEVGTSGHHEALIMLRLADTSHGAPLAGGQVIASSHQPNAPASPL